MNLKHSPKQQEPRKHSEKNYEQFLQDQEIQPLLVYRHLSFSLQPYPKRSKSPSSPPPGDQIN